MAWLIRIVKAPVALQGFLHNDVHDFALNILRQLLLWVTPACHMVLRLSLVFLSWHLVNKNIEAPHIKSTFASLFIKSSLPTFSLAAHIVLCCRFAALLRGRTTSPGRSHSRDSPQCFLPSAFGLPVRRKSGQDKEGSQQAVIIREYVHVLELNVMWLSPSSLQDRQTQSTASDVPFTSYESCFQVSQMDLRQWCAQATDNQED